MITLDEARNLVPGQILVDSVGRRWKVNGHVKTWKRDQRRIRVPLMRVETTTGSSVLTEVDFYNGFQCKQMTLETIL